MRRLIAVLVLLAGVASAQIGIQVQNNGTPIATPSNTTWWGGAFKINFINGGCSWNNSSKRMDCTFSGVTNSGTLTLNHLALGGGAAVVGVDSACVTDDAGAISGCVSINAASLSTGTAPAACGTATGCFGATFASTDGSQVAGQGYIRGHSTDGFWYISEQNSAHKVAINSAYTTVSSGAIGALATTDGPSQIVICTATCSLTPLTPPVAGYQLCVVMAAGVTGTITLNALGNSAMYGKTDGSAYGTAGTGTAVSTSTTGNRICVVGRDSTHYETPAFQGSFTMN